MASDGVIRTSCPACNRRLKCAARFAGANVKCPGCDFHFTLAEGRRGDVGPNTPQFEPPSLDGNETILQAQLPQHGQLAQESIQSPERSGEELPGQRPASLESPLAKAGARTESPPALPPPLPVNRTTVRSRWRYVIAALLGLALVGGGTAWGVQETVNRPLKKALESDPRNSGIEVKAYYANLGLSEIVFDLQKVSATNSKLDVFRVLIQYAAQMKEKRFRKVILAHRGQRRFVVPGDYFQQLGREYGEQNPMYTIRTFPENVRTLDGERAFSVWEGGMLGVLNRQMEDVNQLHQQWFIDDLVNRP